MNPGSTIRGIQAFINDASTQAILGKQYITIVRNALRRRQESMKAADRPSEAEFMKTLADDLDAALVALNDLEDR